MIQIKRVVIDLKFILYYGHYIFHDKQKGMANEYRRNRFSQFMDFLPMHEFRKCVQRYDGNYKVKKLLMLRSVFVYGLCSIDL